MASLFLLTVPLTVPLSLLLLLLLSLFTLRCPYHRLPLLIADPPDPRLPRNAPCPNKCDPNPWQQNKEAAVSGRYWKVGLAAAGGGVLLFLSGGVAAPSVTASLSAVG